MQQPVPETALSTLWHRFARFTGWLFQNSRPQFHYALLVLYHGGAQLIALWLALSLLSVFGILRRIDFDLVAFLVGPLALGALVAGHVKIFIPMHERAAHWIVPGMFGGVCVLTFWVIVRLKWDSVDALSCVAAFITGAALFILLAWLFRLEQKGKQNAT